MQVDETSEAEKSGELSDLYSAGSDIAAARTLECVAVRTETPNIKTFVFRDLDSSGRRQFIAGQAALLSLSIEGVRVDRTFSIASSPSASDFLEMTIKAGPQGYATRWLHDNVLPGSRIEALYPIGKFHFLPDNGARIALVSAGSGASPLMAMLRTLAQRRPDADVAWFHAARQESDVVFRNELALLQRTMPKLAVTVILSEPEPGWLGLRGMISRRALGAAIDDFATRETYCCGPAPFMEKVRSIHAAEGARKPGFHIEHFSSVQLPAAEISPSLEGEFQGHLGGKTFSIRSDESILTAATRQQVVIPTGCATGMCGTCKIRLVAGKAEMRHQGGISLADERQGVILACSSRATSDVKLEFLS